MWKFEWKRRVTCHVSILFQLFVAQLCFHSFGDNLTFGAVEEENGNQGHKIPLLLSVYTLT